MARGFLAGVIWGTVVSGVGAGVLSLAVGTPPPGQSPTASVSAPVGLAPQQQAADTVPLMTEIGDSEPDIAATMPEVTAPVPETPVVAAVDPTVPQVGAAPDAPNLTEAIDDDVSVRVVALDAPVPGEAPQAAPDSPTTDADPQVAETPTPPPVDATAEVDPTPEPEPAAEAEPDTTPEPEPAPDEAPVMTAEEDATDGGPRIGARAGSLVDRSPAVQQNRLPTIATTAQPSGGPETAPDTTSGTAPRLTADSPLVRFASPFTPVPDVPRMALVLIDDGTAPMGPAELETLPFPVSFAIAPGHPDAAGVAKGYRDRGFEVLALAGVPEGATASDVEVTLAGLFDLVPGAVGVLEDPTGSGLQGSREVTAQATAYLSASGHGLVMEPNGLNTAQKLAAKEGVPSITLFRDLDGEGQDEGLIRRTLDQAAFRARQEGSVVMLGRIRAGTISALVLWGLQDRGSTITLVPISTVLRESVVAPTE